MKDVIEGTSGTRLTVDHTEQDDPKAFAKRQQQKIIDFLNSDVQIVKDDDYDPMEINREASRPEDRLEKDYKNEAEKSFGNLWLKAAARDD